MKPILTGKWFLWSAGMAVGAAGGFLYWYYVGCVSGSCPITSSPVNSTLYGGVLGALLLNNFVPQRKYGQDKSS